MTKQLREFVNDLTPSEIEEICVDYIEYENTGKINPKSTLMKLTSKFMSSVGDKIHTNVWMKNLALEAYRTYFTIK